jgi:hypothetical protein
MAEGASRLSSLVVLGGPLKGRRHDLEEVVTEVLIGADDSCHLTVDLPTISPIHARIWADLNDVTVYDTKAPLGVYVNDDRVLGEAKVKDGDVLWLGPPGGDESVAIQCRFEAWVEVLPGAPAADGAEDHPVAADDEAPIPVVPIEAGEATVLEGPPGPAADELGPPAAPPVVETPVVGEPAVPPETPAESARADAEAFFVEAEPPAPPPPAEPEAPAASPPAPPAAPDAPAEPPVAPAAPPPEDDPFFVGEAAPPEPAPPAPPPAATPPGAPAEDAFFIAEDALTLGPESEAPSSARPDAAPPIAPEAPAPGPPPVAEAPLAAEIVMDAEVVEEGVASAPPAAPEAPHPAPPAGPPSADAAERAPLPPRQVTPTSEPAAPPPVEAPAAAAAAEAPAPPEEPEPAPAPRRPSPAARARPTARRGRPVAGARRPPHRRPAHGAPAWLRPVGLGAAAALVVGAIAVGVLGWLGARPKLDQVSPARVRVGQRATLTGSGFSGDASRNTVVFGTATAKVVSASSDLLEVEVPEAVVEAGAERRVPVVVRRGNRESDPLEVSVFAGPNLHGLSPDVAMPGEEVLLAGAGWGLGATVRFGDLAAEVLEIEPTQIRVTVPPLPDVTGTPAPVVVTVGGVDSNPAPFYVGRLPLVIGVAPTAASIGDVLTVSGRGFRRDPAQNDVRIAGVAALVVSAYDEELQVIVPRQPPGEPARPLEVRVPGSVEVGRAIIQVAAEPNPIRLRFAAEPFPGPPERPHAVVSTGIGPAFVLSAANGRSAAQRALTAQQHLNEATATLAAAAGLLPEVRDLATRPVVAVAGYPEAVLEVTEADAAAYNEDWTGLRGRGGPVTAARLARWWEAVYRDLVLMLLRGERPRFAAALAPEGRALQQVFDAGQRTGGAVSQPTVAGLRSSVRTGLRLVALRVPASVTSEAPPTPTVAQAATPAATPTPGPEPLELEGTWTGRETEAGRRRYLTVTFRRSEGKIAYEGGITLTVPFLSYDRPGRNRVRFAVQIRGGMRHYQGEWNGETLSGNITKDQAGENVVGSFELRKR